MVLDAVYDSFPAPCLFFNAAGVLVGVNDQAVREFGFADKDEAVRRFYGLLPPCQPGGTPSADFLRQKTEAAAQSRAPVSFELNCGQAGLFAVNLKLAAQDILIACATKISQYIEKERPDVEERTRLMLDACPFSVALYDMNLQLIDFNEGAMSLYGIPNKQAFLENKRLLVPPAQPDGQDSTELVKSIVNVALEAGTASGELSALKYDGTPFFVEITLVRVRYNGKPAITMYSRDLTGQMKAEENLRKANERTQMMLDASPIAVSLYDEDYNEIAYNEASVKIYGIEDAPAYFNKIELFWPPEQPDGRDSAELQNELFEEAFKNGRAQGEMLCRKMDGTPLFLDLTYVRIEYNNGYAVAEYARDLTAEKAAKEKLRKAEERAQTLVDASPLAISLFESDLTELSCNRAALALYGCSEYDYLERPEVFLAETQRDGRTRDEVAKEIFEAIARDGRYHAELTFLKLDGTPMPLDITYVRLDYDGYYLIASYSRDLTEERAAKEKLRFAEKRAQTLLDASPIAISMYNSSFTEIDCNKTALKLYGVDKLEGYEGDRSVFVAEIQPDGRTMAEIDAEILDTLARGEIYKTNYLHKKIDGTLLPLDVTYVRIDIGEDFLFAAYSRDLTEEIAAREKLREAEERARTLIAACPLAVSLFDSEWRELTCNQAALDLYGLEPDYAFGENAKLFTADKQPDGTPIDEAFERVQNELIKNGRSHAVTLSKKADGTEMLIDASYVRLDYGGYYLIATYSRDLTKEIAAREKLREADERAVLMLDSTPLSCFLLRENYEKEGVRYEAIDCNNAALKLFGFKKKQDAIKKFWKLFPENDGDVYVGLLADKGSLHIEEFNHRNLAGEMIPCEVTAFRLTLRGENVIACYQNDLRQLKTTVEEMKRREIAEEESRAKTRFLARMSHEIRTPMNAVLGITEIQLQQSNLPPSVEEAFIRIHNSSNLLLSIINDILDLSKVEAGKMDIVPRPYELPSLIVDTVQMNLLHLGSKPVDFKLSVDESLPSRLIGDELRIKQILNNLLSNAFKYTDEGSIALSFASEESNTADEVVFVFEVRDTGQGMTKEQLGNLFDEEFIRFNIQSNRDIEGSGLGMSIAHQLIKMMGGEIKAESEPGGGTLFTVRLPQKLGGEVILGEETAKSLENFEALTDALRKRTKTREVRELMPYGRVLVVDDVETNLYVAEGMLEPYGLTVEITESAKEAIQKVESGEVYDIIFMDHMMPEMDGMEATKILRGMGYQQPIVALTANIVKGQAELFMSNGFSGFISKPIDVNQMYATLVRFIRDKQPRIIRAAAKPETSWLRNLISPFLRDAEKALSVLEPLASAEPLENRDFETYVVQLHAIKSALENVKEPELSAMADDLEKAGKALDIETVREIAPRFLTGLRGLMDALVPRTLPDIPDEDPVFLRERLHILQAACRAFDIEGANDVIDTLREKSWSKQTAKLIDEIALRLLQADFEEAAELAGEGFGG